MRIAHGKSYKVKGSRIKEKGVRSEVGGWRRKENSGPGICEWLCRLD